ncbi:MAG: protease, partial [Pseudomonadota bacterium]
MTDINSGGLPPSVPPANLPPNMPPLPPPAPQAVSNDAWDKRLFADVMMAAIKEQRAARRWKIFFRLAFLVLGAALLLSLLDWPSRQAVNEPHTALIDLQGEIAVGTIASAEAVIEALQSAFDDANTKGVILRINSPGGSPVQSAMIYDEIRRLREENPDTPLHVVIEEICASGGYYVAAAADKIYVNQSSIIGSIGVLMDGFGFTEAMKKVGVERRLLTAGQHKGLLDPFSPLDATERTHIEGMLKEVHEQFITAVKQGRGERLKVTADTFSGLVYSGIAGVKNGLADDFGTVDSVARDVIKEENI